MVLALFPSMPFDLRSVDSSFEEERDAAKDAGLEVCLIDHTRVLRGDVEAAISRVAEGPSVAVYRGWMLAPDQYGALHSGVASRGVTLVNAPSAYRVCHHLPESLPYIEGRTPRTTSAPLEGEPSRELLAQLTAPFGDAPIVVKDYVKSQKHFWDEAFFIPSASDLDAVERVVRRFLELQGEDLNVGLVFREYVEFRRIGTHPRSGMPLAAEWRTFWLDGEPILVAPYWADTAPLEEPPIAELRDLVSSVPSRFFTMDIAQKEDDSWLVVELGDGQVSGLPDPALCAKFYRSLAEHLATTTDAGGS